MFPLLGSWNNIVTLAKRGYMKYDLGMQMTGKPPKTVPEQGKWRLLQEIGAILSLAMIGILFAMQLGFLMKPRMDFYNELWAPAHLLVNGESPYDTSSLGTNLPPAWFPMVIGLFFPVGWLPEKTALQAWFVLNAVELCAILWIAQGKRRSIVNSVLLGILAFFFPPTLNHFHLGQISISITLFLLLAFEFTRNKRRWLAAFFFALALSKPHLAALAGLGLSYLYYRDGGLRSMLAFWGRTIALALALCIPLFIAYPGWIPNAIHSMTQNPIWSYPSLFVLFRRYLDAWGIVPWAITSIIVLWLVYLLWKKQTPIRAYYWSLALAPLVSPYVGSWDFVIVLPMLGLTFASIDWKRKILLVVFYAIAWMGMAAVQRQEVSHNHYFWWVPLWFILLATALTNWKRMAKTGSE
ncbi:DUF2029 domain-containing protein [bacterium]|nr:DUF2029 domain-containing protein [bacterium]